ncbi:alternative ribosome rescue aminoacyl-tRNA hydrolase ArfB [Polaribacter dokdonensis]|uniref:Class I peptide chain release factor n=1 Tax=Polaribacter dokdonensis DSW-5 TaxID=1300348 RepID=A0A0M9CFF5_9FLAO|nr:alternative ribosome rescue aminoacyl-tRNA hydrolase ArfB [Polaribacter dokdonensis]KOY51442.1 Class I peptide chain release factor [Polaribacter dokdonensis DSW-5]SEE11267.1 ribosome-associated protein [Polaribacter dokdonensis DSW-5]
MHSSEIIKELKFKAIRSSGAGGQHVNKTSSKIELTFDLENSLALSDKEKETLKEKLASKLTKEHQLIIFCEETRSQHKNKELAIKRFLGLLKTSLIKPKKRRPTKPSRSSILKNVEKNKRNSLKKALRKKPRLD